MRLNKKSKTYYIGHMLYIKYSNLQVYINIIKIIENFKLLI